MKTPIYKMLKPKSKLDVEKNIPQKELELMYDCYEMISLYDDRFTIIDEIGINFERFNHQDSSYYFGFNFFDNYSNKTFYVEYNNNKLINVYVSANNNFEYEIDINNLSDFMFYFKLYEPLKENVLTLFKPKSHEELKNAFEKQHPEFALIVNELFPGEDYNITAYFDAHIGFSVKDDENNKYHFIIQQMHYEGYKWPTISVLDQSKRTEGIGGFFINSKAVKTPKDVEKYINNNMNPKYL
jgi:hypothetical protein